VFRILSDQFHRLSPMMVNILLPFLFWNCSDLSG